MPSKPPSACKVCKRATRNASGLCDSHESSKSTWSQSHSGKTTTQRGYGYQWIKLREQVLNRDRHLCIPCYRKGIFTPATQVDHIVNKKRGGTDELTNLQAICDACHKDKTQKESLLARSHA